MNDFFDVKCLSRLRKREIMKYCNHCKVHIRGNKQKCPLCRNILSDSGQDRNEVYPKIPPAYERHLLIRIMIFISIVSIVVSFVVYSIFPSDINWPMLVVFGLLSMWLSLTLVIRKRHHITKNIMYQVTVVSVLSVFWDWRTGWRGWSLDYVIPVVYITAIFVMYIMAKIMKLSIRDYITYLFLSALFGFIPVLFILFHWVNVIYPSMISVAGSIIFLSAILIFQGENIKAELNKRMHI